jgi:hypothetical protein
VNAGVRPIEIKPTPGNIRRCFIRTASDQRRAALVPMLRLPESVYFSKSEPNLLIANVMPDEESDLFRNEGVRVIPSPQIRAP